MLFLCKCCKIEKEITEFHKHSNGGYYKVCKECRHKKAKNRRMTRTKEEKKLRRARRKESHIRAREVYKLKKKNEKELNEISFNKALYQIIKEKLINNVSKKDLLRDLDISSRFLKRLLKYEGNCYKKETIIDKIKPQIDQIFEETGVREKTFDWLVNDLTKKKLRIDIYYSKHNLAIEYNGIQHYKEVGFKNLEIVQYRDAIKYKSLKEHGVNLFIIKYNDDLDSVYKDLMRISRNK